MGGAGDTAGREAAPRARVGMHVRFGRRNRPTAAVTNRQPPLTRVEQHQAVGSDDVETHAARLRSSDGGPRPSHNLIHKTSTQMLQPLLRRFHRGMCLSEEQRARACAQAMCRPPAMRVAGRDSAPSTQPLLPHLHRGTCLCEQHTACACDSACACVCMRAPATGLAREQQHEGGVVGVVEGVDERLAGLRWGHVAHSMHGAIEQDMVRKRHRAWMHGQQTGFAGFTGTEGERRHSRGAACLDGAAAVEAQGGPAVRAAHLQRSELGARASREGGEGLA
jgi:hypothetical protein